MNLRNLYAVKPFAVKDLHELDLIEDEAHEAKNYAADIEALNRKDNCWSRVSYVDGVPIAMGGVIEIAPGVAHMFMFLDKHAKLYPKLLFKSTKMWIENVFREEWCTRLQCYGLDRPYINRWLKGLGFVCEGESNSYTDSGEKLLLWSKA